MCIFLINEAHLNELAVGDGGVVVLVDGSGVFVEEGDVAESQKFRSAAVGDRGVLTAAAGEEEGCGEEVSLGFKDLTLVCYCVLVEEENVGRY